MNKNKIHESKIYEIFYIMLRNYIVSFQNETASNSYHSSTITPYG